MLDKESTVTPAYMSNVFRQALESPHQAMRNVALNSVLLLVEAGQTKVRL